MKAFILCFLMNYLKNFGFIHKRFIFQCFVCKIMSNNQIFRIFKRLNRIGFCILR